MTVYNEGDRNYGSSQKYAFKQFHLKAENADIGAVM